MKVGDTVWLKSGGPAMTIYQLFLLEASCVWHGGRQDFPITSLTTTNPNASEVTTERNYGEWPPDSVEKPGADL